MMLELVLRQAGVAGLGDVPLDIGVRGGRITEIAQNVATFAAALIWAL